MPQLVLPLTESAVNPATLFSILNAFPFAPGLAAAPTIVGASLSGVGVQGQSGDPFNASAAVEGVNTGNGPGVFGSASANDAVLGRSSSSANAGVAGHNTSTGGVGVYGTGGQYAGKFDGNVLVNGTLTATTDIVLTAADCAEEFDVATHESVEPGTVMVLDETGLLRVSDREYDTKVAGVISGAGEYRPGLILDKVTSSKRRLPLGLVGKLYCKVDSQYAPIEVGDLLTTSPTPGHAMRAADPVRAFGAVIGKALRPLKGVRGLIPVLIALQ
ncbi:MAG TPA: hypothetical protein VN939_06310 [Chthoniobacterales bacterium]|jgi:hypothetical protein|nr:hypothetical protein [Chthoniobacterales bacterium]